MKDSMFQNGQFEIRNFEVVNCWVMLKKLEKGMKNMKK